MRVSTNLTLNAGQYQRSQTRVRCMFVQVLMIIVFIRTCRWYWARPTLRYIPVRVRVCACVCVCVRVCTRRWLWGGVACSRGCEGWRSSGASFGENNRINGHTAQGYIKHYQIALTPPLHPPCVIPTSMSGRQMRSRHRPSTSTSAPMSRNADFCNP